MNLLISLRAELLKTKRTASWYLTILGGASIPLIFFLDVCFGDISPESMKNPLSALYVQGLIGINLAILPVFVILICTLLPQIEYRNNTWKQVFTSPQAMWTLFGAKFLCVQLFIFLFIITFIVTTAISSVAISVLVPSIRLFSYHINWHMILIYTIRTYISVIAFSAFQFMLGLKMKNFISPIAIGFILFLTGNLLTFVIQSPAASLFPYAYPAMIMLPQFESTIPYIQYGSLAYGVLFIILGYRIFIWK